MPRTRPQRRLTQAELDAFLEKAADLLRGGVDHSEFRGYVFALLFYKRINDVYLENVAALEQELSDAELARDPRMHDFVVPDDCVWEKVARKTERDLGTALNDAMRAIERANEPKFDGFLPTPRLTSTRKTACRAQSWSRSSTTSAVCRLITRTYPTIFSATHTSTSFAISPPRPASPVESSTHPRKSRT